MDARELEEIVTAEEAKEASLNQQIDKLTSEEEEFLQDVQVLQEKIADSESICHGLEETMSHCQGALAVLEELKSDTS
jgi:chromosome segregation ATPase